MQRSLRGSRDSRLRAWGASLLGASGTVRLASSMAAASSSRPKSRVRLPVSDLYKLRGAHAAASGGKSERAKIANAIAAVAAAEIATERAAKKVMAGSRSEQRAKVRALLRPALESMVASVAAGKASKSVSAFTDVELETTMPRAKSAMEPRKPGPFLSESEIAVLKRVAAASAKSVARASAEATAAPAPPLSVREVVSVLEMQSFEKVEVFDGRLMSSIADYVIAVKVKSRRHALRLISHLMLLMRGRSVPASQLTVGSESSDDMAIVDLGRVMVRFFPMESAELEMLRGIQSRVARAPNLKVCAFNVIIKKPAVLQPSPLVSGSSLALT
jgi:ribosomal silencing factor RsfS